MTKRPKSASKRAAAPLPKCPVCGREPESCETHTHAGSLWHVGCSRLTPGTTSYHHVVIYHDTRKQAERLWRRLAGKRGRA